jgi:hypothetical protein
MSIERKTQHNHHDDLAGSIRHPVCEKCDFLPKPLRSVIHLVEVLDEIGVARYPGGGVGVVDFMEDCVVEVQVESEAVENKVRESRTDGLLIVERDGCTVVSAVYCAGEPKENVPRSKTSLYQVVPLTRAIVPCWGFREVRLSVEKGDVEHVVRE